MVGREYALLSYEGLYSCCTGMCMCVCTCQTMHMYWIFASTFIYLYFTKTDRVYTPSTRIWIMYVHVGIFNLLCHVNTQVSCIHVHCLVRACVRVCLFTNECTKILFLPLYPLFFLNFGLLNFVALFSLK